MGDLHAALVAFLQGWEGTSPPTLKDVSSPEVKECLNSIFINGHASPESLRHWIDRRVGGELATCMVADQWTLSLRESLGVEPDDDEDEEQISQEELVAIQQRLQEKKRKADEQSSAAPKPSTRRIFRG